MTELEPAAGFTIKAPVTQEVYIKGGESKVLTFENVPKNAIIVEKYGLPVMLSTLLTVSVGFLWFSKKTS